MNGAIANIHLEFVPALLLGGIFAGIAAFLIGAPVLRLRGDYLAIATLGFSEIIRILLTNWQSVTNGALGINKIPDNANNMWWSFGISIIVLILISLLIRSSYGRAFKAIREDDIAAEAMGISLFKHKVMSFVIGGFFAGIGGGLYASLLGTVDPKQFYFTLTYNFLLIIVLGGMGSISGTVIASFIVTGGLELLRGFDEPLTIAGYEISLFRPGFSMVIFSVLLMVIVLFYRKGLMGRTELSWDRLFNFFAKIKSRFSPNGKGGRCEMKTTDKAIDQIIDKNIVLRTENMTMQFGGVVAVDNLHLTIREHQIVALIGPNGAGKTTAFNMITGVYTPSSGKIFLQGEDITGMKPDKITRMGVARTFQNIRLFKDLTVFENIIIAKHFSMKSNVLSATLRLPGAVREEKRMREESEALLERMGLADVRNDVASSLPYGQQRHLEIARALATGPNLLLLDEPAAGMNPQETEDLTASIKQIQQDFNLTVFLIEHHMDLVMEISDRIYVLDFGQTIGKGTPAEIQNNQRVVEAYLGVDDDAEN